MPQPTDPPNAEPMTAESSTAESSPAASASAASRVPLQERVEQATTEERQRAVRALLRHSLITAAGPRAVEFPLVRRHADWLRKWFARNPGWSLHLDAELARLRKIPATLDDPTRPARDAKSGLAFSRRRYVLLCLFLAALEQSDRQNTLGSLADRVIELVHADPALADAGIRFDLGSQDQRRDLVQVARLLLELQVLRRVHGDEGQFLSERGDVLYTIDRPLLSALLNVRRGPSTVDSDRFDERLAAIVEEPSPDTDEGRNRRVRSRLVRGLLDDPVVYYDDLSPEERAYLTSQRGHMLREIEEVAGLVPEVRAEGIAMVDDRGDLTDARLPEEGTDGHIALLLAEFLARQVRRNGAATVGYAVLQRHLSELITEHRSHWRKATTEPGAEVELVEQTVVLFDSLRLVRRTEDGVQPLPAIARYAAAGSARPRPARKQRHLFDDD